MDESAIIHVPEHLAAELAAEAARAGVSTDALAQEAIARHLEAVKTLDHFAALKAGADWALLDRVLSRPSTQAPSEDDAVPV